MMMDKRTKKNLEIPDLLIAWVREELAGKGNE